MPRKLILILVCLCLPALAQAADNPFAPKLPFATAEIKYQLKGNEAGTAVLYVDGQRSARVVDTALTMMGGKHPKKSITITLPDKVIEVDLITRTAKATGNMNTYLAQEYEKLSAAEKAAVQKNAEKLGSSMGHAFAGAPPQITQGAFKGNTVDIATVAGFTSYTWKGAGIVLKTQGSMMGMKIDEEAVSIETGVPVKSQVFEVPAGIAVSFDQEDDQIQRQMAKATLDLLKDPQFESKLKQGGPGMMVPGMGAPDQEEEEDEPPAPLRPPAPRR